MDSECYSLCLQYLVTPAGSCSFFPGPQTHCFCSQLDQLWGQRKLVYQMAEPAYWASSIRLHHLESV